MEEREEELWWTPPTTLSFCFIVVVGRRWWRRRAAGWCASLRWPLRATAAAVLYSKVLKMGLKGKECFVCVYFSDKKDDFFSFMVFLFFENSQESSTWLVAKGVKDLFSTVLKRWAGFFFPASLSLSLSARLLCLSVCNFVVYNLINSPFLQSFPLFACPSSRTVRLPPQWVVGIAAAEQGALWI